MNQEAPIAQTVHLNHDYIQRNDDGSVLSQTRALTDVSLEVAPGEFIAILGHNGSGKSTLARHLNALLLPTSGTVYIDGMDTGSGEKLWDIRRIAGMVFQNPDNQIIGQIVEEDVAFGPENLGLPTEQIRGRVDDALLRVGMFQRRQASPAKLSGGQKQRVSIAGILAMRPKVLVLDEPTAMLDPHGREEVLSAAHALNRQEHITVILITHDMNEAAGADRILVMDHGQVTMAGTPREVFARREELTDLGLTVPMACHIAALLANAGVPIQGTPITMEELAEELARISSAQRMDRSL